VRKVFDPEVKGMLTKDALIRRGWCLPAIEKLLRQPDDLQRNPFQSTSVPNVRLYREERVLAAEQGGGRSVRLRRRPVSSSSKPSRCQKGSNTPWRGPGGSWSASSRSI
jgi:hypothetical protein